MQWLGHGHLLTTRWPMRGPQTQVWATMIATVATGTKGASIRLATRCRMVTVTVEDLEGLALALSECGIPGQDARQRWVP